MSSTTVWNGFTACVGESWAKPAFESLNPLRVPTVFNGPNLPLTASSDPKAFCAAEAADQLNAQRRLINL